jgi:hypothetical protein
MSAFMKRFFMQRSLAIFVCAMICAAVPFASSAAAQGSAQNAKPPAPKAGELPAAAHNAQAGREYSGMYSFLKDGEFVQLSVEDQGSVTGFVSRYGDAEGDKGAFLDQFFRSGKLDGNKVSFTTATVRGEWFEFKGTVERGEGKSPGDEAYYVLKGTLTENTSDAAKKVTTHGSEVVFKMFPAEASPKN